MNEINITSLIPNKVKRSSSKSYTDTIQTDPGNILKRCLRFRDEIIERVYNNNVPDLFISRLLYLFNILYSATTIILSHIFVLSKDRGILELTVSYLIILLNFTGFLMIMFSKPKTKERHLLLMSACLTLTSITNILMKTNIKAMVELDSTINLNWIDLLFLILDASFKLIWIQSYLNHFLYFILSNLVSVGIIVIIYTTQHIESSHHLAYHGVLSIIAVLLSYQLDFLNRMNFYYKFMLETNLQSHNQLCDVINCGLMKIKRKDKHYVIESMNKFFDKEENFFKNWNESLMTESAQLDEEFLFKLMAECLPNISKIVSKKNKDKSNKGNSNICDSVDVLISNKDSLLNLINRSPDANVNRMLLDLIIESKEEFTKFEYLGKKVMREEKQVLTLSLYIRVNYDDSISILLLDETKHDLTAGVNNFVIQSGQFLHDFKNPLLSIAEEISELKIYNDNLFEIILENFVGDCEETAENYMSIIKKYDFVLKMADYCKCMIGSYEDFSRGIFKPREIRVNCKEFSLTELLIFIDNMMKFKLTKANKSAEFILNFNMKENILISTDEVKLKQILINLLSNSEKFTSKGFISLTVSKETISERKFFKFLIEDTGIGMDATTLNKLATPFYSLNENENNKSGCGLGLLIVKELVDKLGTEFKIDSVLGAGSKFSFFIEDKDRLQRSKKEKVGNVRFSSEIQANQMVTIIDNPTFNQNEESGDMNKNDLDETKITIVNNEFNLNLEQRPLLRESNILRKMTTAKENLSKKLSIIPKSPDLKLSFSLGHSIAKPGLNYNHTTVFTKYKQHDQASDIEAHMKFRNLSIDSAERFEILQHRLTLSFKKRREILMKTLSISSKKNKKATKHSTNHKTSTGIKSDVIVNQNFLKPSLTSYFNDLHRKTKISENSSLDFTQSNTIMTKMINVLIVDDYDTIRSSIVKLLKKIEAKHQKFSFKVEQEEDGFKALINIINSNIFNNFTYDIIILDEEMTYMNGSELYKTLKFISDNNIGARGSFDKKICEKIIMCSSDSKALKDKIFIKDEMITAKPMSKTFMMNYILSNFDDPQVS